MVLDGPWNKLLLFQLQKNLHIQIHTPKFLIAQLETHEGKSLTQMNRWRQLGVICLPNVPTRKPFCLIHNTKVCHPNLTDCTQQYNNNLITILHKQAQCSTIWDFLKGTSWCKPTKFYCKKATQQQEKEENLKNNNNKCMSPRYLLGFYPLVWKTLGSSSGIEEFIWSQIPKNVHHVLLWTTLSSFFGPTFWEMFMEECSLGVTLNNFELSFCSLIFWGIFILSWLLWPTVNSIFGLLFSGMFTQLWAELWVSCFGNFMERS